MRSSRHNLDFCRIVQYQCSCLAIGLSCPETDDYKTRLKCIHGWPWDMAIWHSSCPAALSCLCHICKVNCEHLSSTFKQPVTSAFSSFLYGLQKFLLLKYIFLCNASTFISVNLLLGENPSIKTTYQWTEFAGKKLILSKSEEPQLTTFSDVISRLNTQVLWACQ